MIYTISAGISDTPIHWQCVECGEEITSRDVAWVERARLHHTCPTERDIQRARYYGTTEYYGRVG